MGLNERFLEYLNYMNNAMKQDLAAGHQWKYCNSKSKKASGFEQARKQGKYLVNCVDGVQWGLRAVGVPSSALHWYGTQNKIAWTKTNGEAGAKEYFEIIKTGGKTVRQLYESGTLCDGDIMLGFTNMNHTTCYFGHGMSFDTGHAYCFGSGEGAKFRKFIGSLSCGGSKVNYIMRLKDRAHYRVQVGAFSTDDAFNEMAQKLNAAGYKTLEINEGGLKKIQVGFFSGKTNAEDYAAQVSAKGFPAIVVEASETPATPVVPIPAPQPTPAPVPTPAKSIGYRVQVGAFKKPTERDKVGTNIKKKLNLDTFWEKQGGTYYLYCGSFSDKAVADARVAQLQSNGFSAFIKEIKV